MGSPWKKQRGKPGVTDQEFWGALYPLFENGTIAGLINIGKEQKRMCRMKYDCLKLQEKNRLLKRKIRDFHKQGEENGKSKDIG
jgi:hypothetical protein